MWMLLAIALPMLAGGALAAWRPKDRPAGAPAAQGPGAQPAGKAVERLKEDMDWMDRFLEQTGGKE